MRLEAGAGGVAAVAFGDTPAAGDWFTGGRMALGLRWTDGFSDASADLLVHERIGIRLHAGPAIVFGLDGGPDTFGLFELGLGLVLR